FVATAITALRRAAAPALLASGLVLAVTPMALFMGSSVNPSGVEIAASIALWACGIVLVATSGERVEDRLVTATGIAARAPALTRQLGPLWLRPIAATVCGLPHRAALRTIARSA